MLSRYLVTSGGTLSNSSRLLPLSPAGTERGEANAPLVRRIGPGNREAHTAQKTTSSTGLHLGTLCVIPRRHHRGPKSSKYVRSSHKVHTLMWVLSFHKLCQWPKNSGRSRRLMCLPILALGNGLRRVQKHYGYVNNHTIVHARIAHATGI